MFQGANKKWQTNTQRTNIPGFGIPNPGVSVNFSQSNAAYPQTSGYPYFQVPQPIQSPQPQAPPQVFYGPHPFQAPQPLPGYTYYPGYQPGPVYGSYPVDFVNPMQPQGVSATQQPQTAGSAPCQSSQTPESDYASQSQDARATSAQQVQGARPASAQQVQAHSEATRLNSQAFSKVQSPAYAKIQSDVYDIDEDFLADGTIEAYNANEHIEKNRSKARVIVPIIIIISLLAIAVALLKCFVIDFYQVPTIAMEDTLQSGDFVLYEKVTKDFEPIACGEIVVLEDPDHQDEEIIKRVVATAGQSVSFKDGHLYVDGNYVDTDSIKPIVNDATMSSKLSYPYTVPDGQVFVLGDNRQYSQDSRSFGPVSLQQILGKAKCVVLPPSSIKSL